MVEELTILSFSKFGAPVKFDENHFTTKYSRKKYHLQQNSPQKFFMYEQDGYFEPLKGLAVIFVKSESGNIKEFLFDKKIKVTAGTWMCITAYGDSFSYLAYTQGQRKMSQEEKAYLAKPNKPKVQLDSLLAAMYQDKGLDFVQLKRALSFWFFIYMDKGSMECKIEKEKFILTQGECIFIAPNQKHSLRASDTQTFSFFTVIFEMSYCIEEFDGKVFKADVNIHEWLKSMISEVHSNSNYKIDKLCSIMEVVIVSLLSSKEKQEQAVPISSTLNRKSLNAIVEKCLELIDGNISGDLSVPKLAQHLNISPSYLSKVFREETGISLSEYVREYRMERSKQLIRQGEYTLSQIADMLGFSSLQYFSAQFKSRYGIPPSEYSRALKQD